MTIYRVADLGYAFVTIAMTTRMYVKRTNRPRRYLFWPASHLAVRQSGWSACLFLPSRAAVRCAVQFRSRDGAASEPESADSLRGTIAGQNRVALVVPESASIDSLAAAVGLQALCKDWGVAARIAAEGNVTGEDSKAFCNIFDIDVTILDENGEGLPDCDAGIAIGGGGAVPRLSNNPPVVAVIRHRPTAEENILTITRTDDGATSTVVTELVREMDVRPRPTRCDGAALRHSRRNPRVPTGQRRERL